MISGPYFKYCAENSFLVKIVAQCKHPSCQSNMHRYRVVVSTFDRRCCTDWRRLIDRAEEASVPTRLQMWGAGGGDGPQHSRNGRAHLQSLCDTASFLTPWASLIHIPATHTHTHLCLTLHCILTILIFPLQPQSDSQWKLGVTGVTKDSCRLQRERQRESYRF